MVALLSKIQPRTFDWLYFTRQNNEHGPSHVTKPRHPCRQAKPASRSREQSHAARRRPEDDTPPRTDAAYDHHHVSTYLHHCYWGTRLVCLLILSLATRVLGGNYSQLSQFVPSEMHAVVPGLCGVFERSCQGCYEFHFRLTIMVVVFLGIR